MTGFSSRGIFLSYRREDAAPYARLLQYQLSEHIPSARIFVDLDSIEPGLDFAEVIREAVDSCALLVALIGRQWTTLADEEGRRRLDNPDDYVRFEVQTALERGIRVIPVLVDGARPPRQQELPVELHKLARLNALELSYGRYQYDADRLIDLIQRVVAPAQAERLAREAAGPPVLPERASSTRKAGDAIQASEPLPAVEVTAETDVPTLVVDRYQKGDFTTIGAAIKAARPGDRILVRPGLYREALVIDKPLEVLGDGPVADIEIEARGTNALLFKGSTGRIANLTLRQADVGGNWFGLDITQGRLEVEGCDITSQSSACVAIRNGADPLLRRNRLHDSNECGVWVYDGGLGTLEDNEIAANRLAGVEIKTGGNPTLRRNRIHDGEQSGVLIWGNGRGTLEDNEITAHYLSGVEIKTGGNPTLRRNRIHDSKSCGVLIWEDGRGTLEDNEITGNRLSGVEIKTGGNPTLRRNRINDNRGSAVFVHDRGRGVFEDDNDLTGNAKGAWSIASDCERNVKRPKT
jgi:parallel beta-helix repeat protein